MTLLYPILNFVCFFNFSKALIKLVRQYWINYHHIKSTKKSIKLVSNRKLGKRLQVTNYEYRSLNNGM